MDIINYKKELEDLKTDIDSKLLRVSSMEKELQDQERDLKYASGIINKKMGNIVEKDEFLKFFKKPYFIKHEAKNRVLVFVPKFVKGFQVGWLWKDDETFYVYSLDRYSAWLGDVPKELLSEINFKKLLEGTVQGETVYFDPAWKDAIKKRLGHHLKDIGENTARITKGHIFDVIAEMIDSGCLPFKPRPVDPNDTRAATSQIKLRPYQKAAADKFMETGAVGIFHPTGSGKSIIGLHIIDTIKGDKLIVVPTKTLADQWQYYIEKYVPRAKDEVKITTYQGWRNGNDEYSLVIFDEVQRLPADTFSRLGVIRTKYRIGLSATPHREDGREKYIFALTGFPIGLNWKEYMETVGRSYHPIFVHVVKSITGKMSKLRYLLDMNKKTFIFCDSIDLGKRISRDFSIPFIYGQSENRLQEVESNKVMVVSRVMDLGVSVKDLERIIEVDFLFGSRQQELQRTGRLMHSESKNVRHDIIMTESEISQYGKRLWSLQEKGFTVKVIGG